MVQFHPIGLCPRSREPCDGSQRLVACFNTYIIRFEPRAKPKPSSSLGYPARKSHFLGSRDSSIGYRAIENREGLGFEGLISPTGGGKDPPMWGTVLILVPYPTTLVINVWPNCTSVKSYMPANIGPQQGGGARKLMRRCCAKTYDTHCIQWIGAEESFTKSVAKV